MATSKTTAGWSTERRRAEIRRLFLLMVKRGLEERQIKQLLANRFLIGVNTVEGWISAGEGTRPPPDWRTLDLLRYELGEVAPRHLIPPAETA